MNYFQPMPCGTSLPANNPHAVSVHFPTMEDVAGYETKQDRVLQQLQSAYPRFRANKYVEKCCSHIRQKDNIADDLVIIPVSSKNVFTQVEKLTGTPVQGLSCGEMNFIVLEKNSPDISVIRFFLQHTGLNPSSRRAEDYLLRMGELESEYIESRSNGSSPDLLIRSTLADAYGSVTAGDVYLANTGMNAIYSVFDAVKSVQSLNKRDVIIQLGWLYLDTMEIVDKYSTQSFNYINLLDLDGLESYLSQNHKSVAAVITEIPTNPLIQTVDLPRLSKLLKRYDIPLIIDSSIGTPFNIEFFEYCDIVVESLTKFACGQGDTMMGAVLFKRDSRFAQSLKDLVAAGIEPPYEKDIRHLAHTIQSYGNRVELMSENTMHFIEYLNHSPIIKKVHHAMDADSMANYSKIRKGKSCIPGLLSIVFDKPLQFYYDRLNIPKGPSFGTEFTLTMPYVYLAHYDLATSPKGKKQLLEIGLDPELLRVSVGIERIETIIGAFEAL